VRVVHDGFKQGGRPGRLENSLVTAVKEREVSLQDEEGRVVRGGVLAMTYSDAQKRLAPADKKRGERCSSTESQKRGREIKTAKQQEKGVDNRRKV